MAQPRFWLWIAGPGRAGHFLRLRGQERPVPAARLVARRHGRPHARQRADPCRDDGGGGRVPRGPLLSGVHARGAAGDRLRRLHYAVHGRLDRPDGHRHQTGAGLFHRQPTGFHDVGPRAGRVAGRHVPPVHPRFLQVALVPLLRVGDPFLRHQRDAEDGRIAAENALHGRHHARRLPGNCRGGHPDRHRAERLPLQGLHHRPSALFLLGESSLGRAVLLRGARPAPGLRPSTCSASGT